MISFQKSSNSSSVMSLISALETNVQAPDSGSVRMIPLSITLPLNLGAGMGWW